MTEPVMRYVKSSQSGTGPLIAMQSDLPKMIVTRTGGMPLEYGVKGQELMRRLKEGMRLFIRAMELQGLTLMPLPQGNPLCLTHENGVPYASYSVSKSLMEALPDELLDNTPNSKGEVGRGPATQLQPKNLDDSGGLVDYRFVGVFWAPQVSMEIAVERDKLLAKEKSARNPRTWGSGKSIPNTPSIG